MRSAPEAALISSCPIGSDNNSSLFEDTPVNASFPPLPRARKLCVRGSKCAGSAPPYFTVDAAETMLAADPAVPRPPPMICMTLLTSVIGAFET